MNLCSALISTLYRRGLLLATFGLSFFTCTTIANDEQIHAGGKISAQSFSRLPAYNSPKLSPNGSRIVFIQNLDIEEPVALLAVYDFDKKKSIPLINSDNQKTKINWYRWANDDVVLVSVRNAREYRAQHFFETKLFGIDITQDKIEPKVLIRPKTKTQNWSFTQFKDTVVDVLSDDSEHILTAVDYNKPGMPSVYKVNVYTGASTAVKSGTRNIRRWMSDRSGAIRIGLSFDTEQQRQITYHIPHDSKDFEVLFEHQIDEPGVNIVGFDHDPHILYYTAYLNDKRAFYSMDLRDKQSTLLLQHEQYDVAPRLIYSEKLDQVIGYTDPHIDNGKLYFSDYLESFYTGINKAFPDTYNQVVSFDAEENRYILYAQGDGIPGAYFLGDRQNKGIVHLFDRYPELYSHTLSSHEKVMYLARDQLQIEAYLTLPSSGEAPYPTVIYPHGGPGTRDFGGFDPYVSFLSSRGYAVFRPNFRGSQGYGFEFAQAQMQGWGLQMQDDISDGTQYLIDQGIADKDNVCIVGASYGGYAAAMAAVKTPELYTCAASFAGVFDLPALKRKLSNLRGGRELAERQFGSNTDDLLARSPVSGVSKVQIPILLMHGETDSVVDVDQSRGFFSALKRANKQVKFVEFEQGDHFLSRQDNRTRFFAELEAFLAQHLHD
ncbi:alpha/beta hydrolase family protein [Ningiella sp. W23]|uniref:alpha/beta hydrolase family protein n=1 Tax=Ningiella sp. W23 TaxID=3023715 RepID=UPI003756FE5E